MPTRVWLAPNLYTGVTQLMRHRHNRDESRELDVELFETYM